MIYLRIKDQADHSEFLCGRSFIAVKKDRESFEHTHQKGDGECPTSSLIKDLYTFTRLIPTT